MSSFKQRLKKHTTISNAEWELRAFLDCLEHCGGIIIPIHEDFFERFKAIRKQVEEVCTEFQ